MDILQDFTPVSIRAAIDANEIAYGQFLARQPGGIWHHDPGVNWLETRHQLSIFNGVLHTHLTPDSLPAEVDRVRAHFEQRHLPFRWRIGPSSQPANLDDCLPALGIAFDYEEPGMAVDLLALHEDIQVSSEIVIQPVTTRELLWQWAQTWGCGVTPEAAVRQFFLGHADLPFGLESPMQLYLGVLDGEPVATAKLFFGGGVACIHDVVTLHRVRRQGIGAAMTLEVARTARQLGYRVGVLSASPFGIGIYRRLGFREYCTLRTYQWFPAD
jgi:GNAT superfamily N-acetyltransferase